MESLKKVAKGIAGAVAASATSLGTAYVFVPPEVQMPWYGYLAVALINAGIGFAVVYNAPKNAS